MDLIGRARRSLPDAAWIRRQFTLDADAAYDAVHAARLLLRTPSFTAIIVVVFAIGIGGATAIISMADALFMRPLPVPADERVVTVWQYNRDTGTGRGEVAPGNALDWITRTRSFEAAAVAEASLLETNIPGRQPETLAGARVSERFFEVLRAPMLHGRAFLPQEFQRGAGRVAVLSYGMWMDRFGGEASIVGQAVRLDGANLYTVVGVMPQDLELRLFDNRARQPEPLVWLPKLGFEAFEPNLRVRGYWNVLARLAPGVSIDQARAELDALSAQLAREYPQTNKNIVAEIVPLREHLAGGLHDVLPLLLGAAAILLLVACANVANLVLARGVSRGREFAVRQALGAGRGRLIRQMLVETLLLATLGGVAGLALARWTLDLVALLRPLDVARVDRVPIDARAAFVACAVTIIAAIIAGLTPSLQLTRPAAASALREGRSASRRGLRAVLVVVEVAAAVVLTVGAALLGRSFVLIQRVDPGFRADDVSVLQVFLSGRVDTPPKRVIFFEQVLDRMRALPGVVAAGAVSAMPFGDAKVSIRLRLSTPDRPVPPGEELLVYTTVVGGDYFQAMGVPLVAGRLFDTHDTAAARQVAVVSRNAGQQLWPGANPIGSRVQFRFMGVVYDAEVVGVVGDVRHDALNLAARAEVFIPVTQAPLPSMTFVVRTAPGSPPTLDTLKKQIWALDPLQSLYSTTALDQLISRTLVGRRFSLFLLGGFALATLLLASAGVYGVMSFVTSQRTREFGLRMALGAERRDIVGLVLGQGVTLAGIGVVVGVVVALPLAQLLRTLLFGVTATDPLTFAFVSLTLVGVAMVACYLPARRALKVHPVDALRVD